MLRDDPSLKAMFEQRLRDDPKFAADPAARLDFFARRPSSWHRHFNRYPVLRIDRAPDLPE